VRHDPGDCRLQEKRFEYVVDTPDEQRVGVHEEHDIGVARCCEAIVYGSEKRVTPELRAIDPVPSDPVFTPRKSGRDVVRLAVGPDGNAKPRRSRDAASNAERARQVFDLTEKKCGSGLIGTLTSKVIDRTRE